MYFECVVCHSPVMDGERDNVGSLVNCGHLFHFTCLKKYLGIIKACPQCENKVNKETSLIRIYPMGGSGNNSLGHNSMGSSKENLNQSVEENNRLNKQILDLQKSLSDAKNEIRVWEVLSKQLQDQTSKEEHHSTTISKTDEEVSIKEVKLMKKHIQCLESDLSNAKKDAALWEILFKHLQRISKDSDMMMPNDEAMELIDNLKKDLHNMDNVADTNVEISERDKLKETNKQYLEEINNLKQKMDAQQISLNGSILKYNQTKDLLETTKADLDSTKAHLRKTIADLESTRADLESAKADLDSTTAELVSTGAELDSTRADLESAKADLDATTAELFSTGAELDSTRADLESARADLNSTTAELVSTGAELDSTKEEIHSIKVELDSDLESTKNNMDSSLSLETNENNRKIVLENSHMKRQLESVKKHLHDYDLSVTALVVQHMKEITNMQEENVTLKALIETLTEQNTCLKNDNRKLTEDKKVLQQENVVIKRQIIVFQNERVRKELEVFKNEDRNFMQRQNDVLKRRRMD